MYLEIFVVATSLVLGFLLLLLTAVTQLQAYAARGDENPTFTAFRGPLSACFRTRSRNKRRKSRAAGAVGTTDDPGTARDGPSLGKKARRTERRRQIKRVLVNTTKQQPSHTLLPGPYSLPIELP